METIENSTNLEWLESQKRRIEHGVEYHSHDKSSGLYFIESRSLEMVNKRIAEVEEMEKKALARDLFLVSTGMVFLLIALSFAVRWLN